MCLNESPGLSRHRVALRHMGLGKQVGVWGGAWEGQKIAVVAMTNCEQKGLGGLVACYMWFRKFFAALY